MLGAGGDEEEEAGAPELVSTCWVLYKKEKINKDNQMWVKCQISNHE